MESTKGGAHRACRSVKIMTIMVNFHQLQYCHFKSYYLIQVRGHLKEAFPELVSYQRLVALTFSVLMSLVCLP